MPTAQRTQVTLANLGNAYGTLGDAARQRDFLERALAVEERVYGPDHREVRARNRAERNRKS